MNTLELRDVSISIRETGRRLVSSLNLKIEPGSIVTIMGPSGSGKSSLVAFLAGHLDPTFEAEGAVLCGHRDITRLPPEKRRMGVLFQDDMLFPHLSVGGNLSFGLSSNIKGKQERADRVAAALHAAGLADFAKRDPATLSGGQRARVALMRILLSEPLALLLDEPFSKLDAELRGEIRDFVFLHARQWNLPVLLVTHDEEDARAATGPIVDIQSGAFRQQV